MTRIGWWLADGLAGMLERDERDAVFGDFAESGETGERALRNVMGLVVRRQAALWKDWRPWLTLVGLVIPLGILLSLGSRMMASRSATPIWMYVNNWTMAHLESPGARGDLVSNSAAIFKQYLMLVCWSWASGFMLAPLSRRTIRVNGTLFCLIVLFAELLKDPTYLLPGRNHDGSSAVFSLMFYRVMFPLILQAVLVLLPAVWGMHQGLRLATFPLLLRAILWASAVATVAALAIQNWGWVLCTSGRFRGCMEWSVQVGYARLAGRPQSLQIPALPLALAGPVGYMVATMVWQRWRGKTAPV
jgi:hypothetical protein